MAKYVDEHGVEREEAMTKTIKISDSNHDFLYGLCSKDMSFNDALTKVIKIYKKYKGVLKASV